MPKYRKTPVEIDAYQFTGGDLADFTAWVESLGITSWSVPHFSIQSDSITIRTLEGNMRADIGDWVICGVNGELYPCKPDIFEKTYTPSPQTIVEKLNYYIRLLK